MPGLRLAGIESRDEAMLQNRADLHIHSVASDGGPIEDILDRAMELRLNAIAITDHDCLGGAIQARRIVHRDRLPLAVVPGIEVSSRDGHIGALFVNRDVPKGLPAAKTIELIHEAGGIAVAHHPFVPALFEEGPRPDVA